MKRWIAVCIVLIFVTGCSGTGGGANRFLPGVGSPNAMSSDNAMSRDSGTFGIAPEGSGRRLPVVVRMRIPRHQRGERTPIHPATISSQTQSVSFAVNGGKAQIFNATVASSNCTSGASGRTCTFMVGAPAGLDTFVVTTYSATGGTGTALNRGTAKFNIVKGKVNAPKITLGPLVSTTADTGMGSLRYAIGTANSGDTIVFALPASSPVQLTTPITISTNVNIAGAGVTKSARPHRNRHGLQSNSTFTGTTISGKDANQVFIIKTGVNVTISGVVITAGKASVASQPGGAISNLGNLTLSGDAITDSTSVVTTIARRPHAQRAQRAHPPTRHKHPAQRKPRVTHRDKNATLHPHACSASAQYGGAMYNDGTVNIIGTTFDGNSVANTCTAADGGGGLGNDGSGGAIYNDTDGSLFISGGSVFSNNAAAEGGAIYNDGTYGQVSVTSSTFTGNSGCTSVNGCAAYGCTLGSGCSVYAYGDGSAIYDVSGPGITITNSTFSNNVAGGNSQDSEGYGGALDLEGTAPLITGSTFSGNLAGGGTNCSGGQGGAIYEEAGSPLVLNNNTFLNNTASGDEGIYFSSFHEYLNAGGAIFNYAEPDQGSNNTFTGNATIGTGSVCETEPYVYGGTVFAYYGISMSNSTFSGNSSSSAYDIDGGVLYMDDPSVLNNDTFTGNKASTTSLTDEDGYIYGGVLENDDGLKLTKNTFTSNSAMAGGAYGYEVDGGVLASYYPLAMNGNTFTSNTSAASYPDDGYVYGGVIYIENNSTGTGLTSVNDTFKSNAVVAIAANTPTYESYGGVIYGEESSYGMNLNSDAFTSNTVSAQYCGGGAVYVDSYYSPNSISNSSFTGNVCSSGTQQGWGGALYTDSRSSYYQVLAISGSTFTGNSATAGGGAIYDYGYKADTITNSTFSGNKVPAGLADYGGGAIDAAYSAEQITNSTFTGNTVTATQVTAGGGAIFNEYGIDISGSTFSGNQTTGAIDGSGGGALFNYDGGATVVNSTFNANSSGEDGGAVMEYPGSFSSYYTNVTFSKNATARNGGNIENNDSVYLYNTIVAGGTAGGQGKDIDNAGGIVYSEDYNLLQTAPAVNPMVTPNPDHDITGKDPVLLALSDNGGPTFTMADTSTSPGRAVIPFASSNCGNASPAVNVDQRGFARGAGSKCDIGAYEYAGVASAIRVRAKPHRLARARQHRPHASPIPKRKRRDPHEIHHPSTGGK